jgi:hypothetical protein
MRSKHKKLTSGNVGGIVGHGQKGGGITTPEKGAMHAKHRGRPDFLLRQKKGRKRH